MWYFFLGMLCYGSFIWGVDSLSSLYYALDPLSITQNQAFYELYPNSPEGEQALERVQKLLHSDLSLSSGPLILPKLDIQAIVSLITRSPSDPPICLTEEQISVMEKIGSQLHNKKLKGSSVWREEEVLCLPPEEVDLARALLLCQFGEDPDKRKKILQYEASLDLMAIQIRARLGDREQSEEKIRQINQFIFYEMGFRFPPRSLYAKDIDLYSFLPSVLDSRKGVCLGVTVLYLCLAQRLDLPLEIVTPPGHIYVRYHGPEEMINIETTARGINLPSEVYLGINTRSLDLHNIKEVVGHSLVNEASVFWQREQYEKAVAIYEHAQKYLSDDPLLKMLLGINYLFIGEKKKGKDLLESIRTLTFDHAVSPETMPSDYLQGKVDAEGLKAVFLPVDETRESILAKQKTLQECLKKYPKFRAGLFQLAVSYLQLARTQEALETLLAYHAIDPTDATVEYYLSILCQERLDYPKAWIFFKNTKTLVQQRNHEPKALLELFLTLRQRCPDPETHAEGSFTQG